LGGGHKDGVRLWALFSGKIKEDYMFTVGQLYERQEDIHDRYGGNRQSGIASCANYPYIFLFSSPRGEEYGYEDGWITAREYLYTGEGQQGDMEMVRGNKAIYQHQQADKELHLFEKHGPNRYEYLGEFEYVSHQQQIGQDAIGQNRSMIVFRLRRV
jgi:5-methylcytosine-specific restriction protein A